jgi:hypothetical protein
MPLVARRAAVAALVVLLGAGTAVCAAADGAPPAAPETPAPVVRYRDGLLSVRADGVPLPQVLAAIEAQTGLQFSGEPFDLRDVRKHFTDVPLALALRRVIGRQNFTLVYGDDGTPRRVELLGVPRPPVTATPRRPRRSRQSFAALLQQEPPVPVSARIAAATGAGRLVPLGRVTAMMRVDDPGVRGDAIDALLLAMRRNPGLQARFVALSDVHVAALVRAWGGRHAAEVLRTLEERTPDPRMRALARRAAGRLAR